MKFKLKKITVIVLLLATIIGQVPLFYSQPKKAEAFLGIGDITFNTEIGNWYDILKDIAKGAALRVAQNYVNQSLTRYLDQITNKYKIRNFLYYDQVLTSNYLLNYLRDKVEDPDLRRLLLGVQKELISTDSPNMTSAERRSFTVRLKNDIQDMYKSQTGIDPALVANPPADMSNEDYLLNARAYFFNPMSTFEARTVTQMMALAQLSAAAAAAETAAGQGNKSSRELRPSNQTSVDNTIIQIRDAIANPGGFVKDFTQEIVNGLFANNYVSDNPYTRIGSQVGNFLWTKLGLTTSGGVYNEYSYSYTGTEFELPGTDPAAELDFDEDGFPDGLDADQNGVPEDCYHGNLPPGSGNPGDCAGSATVGSSAYFNTLCRAIASVVTNTNDYYDFITQNQDDIDINGVNFVDDGPSDVWGRKTMVLANSVDTLQNALDSYNRADYDTMMIRISPYAQFISKVGISITADGQDLDLAGAFSGGGGGIDNLIHNTGEFRNYIGTLRGAIGRCESPNAPAGAAVPPGNYIVGAAACTTSAGLRGNDPGAPTAAPNASEVNFQQGDNVGSWDETGLLSSVSITGNDMIFDYDKGGTWPPYLQDASNGTYAVGNPWIMIWRNGQWQATTFSWLRPNQYQKPDAVIDVFCGGINGGVTFGDFAPVAGETYGFMISGIARNMSQNNIRERTNIYMFTWPAGINPDE